MSLTTLNLNKRRILSTGTVLPTGYAELEYLRSSGTQYISISGFSIQSGDSVSVKYCVDELTDYGGIVSSNTAFVYRLLYQSATLKLTGCSYNSASTDTPSSATVGTTYDVIIDSTVTSSGFEVFGYQDAQYLLKGKIYSVSIIRSGSAILNFIPAKRNSDNVLGMYDTVENKFYTNAGTGTFIAGPRKYLPSSYRQLEYIESSGTQYIDTNHIPTSETSIELTWKKADEFNGSNNITGVRNRNDASTRFGFISNSITYGGYFYSSVSYESQALPTEKSVWKLTPTDFYVDGSLEHSHSSTLTTDTLSLTLFAFNNSNGFQYQSEIIYGCKIWTGTALIRNFIPARRLSDNVAGMYDLVTDTFYTNAGTGTFIEGPEVSRTVTTNKAYMPYYPSTDLTGLTTQTGTPTPTNPIYPTCVQPYNLQGIGTYTDKYFVSGGVDETGYTGDKVDMGTLDWTYSTTYGTHPIFISSTIADMYSSWSVVCWTNKYSLSDIGTSSGNPGSCTRAEFAAGTLDKTYAQNTTNTIILVRDDSYTDVATFKAAMSGAYLYYQTSSQTSWTAPTHVGAHGKIRNIGVKVLDGTESWTNYSGVFSTAISLSIDELPSSGDTNYPTACSHFIGHTESSVPAIGSRVGKIFCARGQIHVGCQNIATNVATWKAYLAAQYAAGTPVIIYYPLATPTTETASFAKLIMNKRRVLFTKTITPGETFYPGDTTYPDD